jgi:hypothetical protein
MNKEVVADKKWDNGIMRAQPDLTHFHASTVKPEMWIESANEKAARRSILCRRNPMRHCA